MRTPILAACITLALGGLDVPAALAASAPAATPSTPATGVAPAAGDTAATLGTGAAIQGTTSLGGPGTVAVLPAASGGVGVVTTLPNPPQPATPTYTVSNTPIFDQAAREGLEKEARRRARGDEPRVYGIAPRTENDLTWQMPDDRIIRY